MMSPVTLFLQADIVVKVVMAGLLLASIATWAIIFIQWRRMRRANRENDRFERDFCKSEDIDSFYEERGRSELPSATVLAAGVAEWRRSTAGKTVDREGTRARLAVAMHSAGAAEAGTLAARLHTLASAGAQNPSLAVAPPGIAEALFATALGLFAAIPAVIAYNRFSYGINRIEARLQRFADGFHGTLSRDVEVESWRMAMGPILAAGR